MNLAPSDRERELEAEARAAFAAGDAPPAATSCVEACIVAATAGREAPDRAHVWAEIARLLGWSGGTDVTVALGVTGDRCELVARAAVAGTLVVADLAGAVAAVDMASTARTARPTIDDPHACRVDLPAGWRDRERPHDVEGALTRALVLLAADCAGAAAAAYEATLARVRDRPRRDGALGDLQVVRHRLANLVIDVVSCRDAVLDAAGRIDRGEAAGEVRLAAVRAKATAVHRGRRVTAEALRLAGGIGILDEHPWQRWFRRVKAAEPLLGSPRDHRAELARASLARFR